jgi:hypothetical protein
LYPRFFKAIRFEILTLFEVVGEKLGILSLD